MNKLLKTFILLVPILAFSLVGFYLTNREKSKDITVNFKNTKKVVLQDTTDSSHDDAKDLSFSGEKINLIENHNYSLVYEGSAGFDDGQISISYKDSDDSVSINPYYSADRLKGLLNNERDSVFGVLSKKYNNFGLYKIGNEKMYHFGEWYGAALVYKGKYSLNSDTLKVVLKKENGSWVVKTNPPGISLSKYSYPEVPFDVLSDVNNFL